MKVIKEKHIYLVSDASEVIAACRDACPAGTLDYTEDHIFLEEAVYGIAELPKKYPFVLVCTYVDNGIFSHIDTEGFGVAVFENRGDDAKERLFSFRIRRTQNVSPYAVKETDYQMPGRDILEATLKVGQTFHRDEEYNLEILNSEMVR